MPPDRRNLRDTYFAWRTMKRYARNTGQIVEWFRFNPTATTSDPVYGTGPQRIWYPSISIPVIQGIYGRAPRNFDDDGLYLVDRVRVVMSYDAFFHSMIPDPDPSGQDHQNDRFRFDNTLFTVVSFLPQGRVADNFLTISISGIQVAASEMAEDVQAAMFSGADVVPDSPVT